MKAAIVIGALSTAANAGIHTVYPGGAPSHLVSLAESTNRVSVVYDNQKPADATSANDCSNDINNKIKEALNMAYPYTKHSTTNTDFNSEIYKKWFGTVSDSTSNNDVLSRMSDATDMMALYEKDWQSLCCYDTSGSCGGCSLNTMAYVTSYSYSSGPKKGTKYSSTWVRACKLLAKSEPMTIGFVYYHELIHMVSGAGDGYGGYSKSNCVQLAASEPEMARLTANNYMLYAMQNSLSAADYAKYTTGWGGNYISEDCNDRYSNCYDMATDSCCDSRSSAGSQADGSCCASCQAAQATSKCQAQLNNPVCVDNYSNCGDLAGNPPDCEGYSVGRNPKQPLSEVCCVSCKAQGEPPVEEPKAPEPPSSPSEPETPSTPSPPPQSQCQDLYSNCGDLAQQASGKCQQYTIGDGSSLADACCKSCEAFASQGSGGAPSGTCEDFNSRKCRNVMSSNGIKAGQCGSWTYNGQPLDEICCESCTK